MKNNLGKIRAFTLVELLVVISIISVLSSLVLVGINSAQAKGRDSRRTQDLVQFRNALELYASGHNGKYPATVAGTVSYTSTGVSVSPAGSPAVCGTGSTWTDNDIAGSPGLAFVSSLAPFMPNLPKDPVNNSNHCYIYKSSATGVGIDSDAAVFFEPSLESVPGSDTGVLVGTTTGSGIAGAPALDTVVGLPSNPPPPPPPPPSGPMCSGTINCAQFTQYADSNPDKCTYAFSPSVPNGVCQIHTNGDFVASTYTTCINTPNVTCASKGVAWCQTWVDEANNPRNNGTVPPTGCTITQ